MEQPGLIEAMAGHRSEHFLSRINPRKDMHHKHPVSRAPLFCEAQSNTETA